MGYNQNITMFMRKHFDKEFGDVTNEEVLIKEFQKAVKSSFLKLKNVNDFLDLFNVINTAIYTKSHPLKIEHLYYHAFHNKHRYNHFLISKKAGGTRTIHAPISELKNIQKTLNIIFQCLYKTPMAVHGFTQKRSVVTNAQKHVGKNYVYNIDLKNFFPSIHKARIEKRFEFPPFHLNGKKAKLAVLISRLITQKVYEFTNNETGEKEVLSEDIWHTLNLPENKAILEDFSKTININSYTKYAALPQGAPTSPVISNIICERLDRRLLGLAKRFGVTYTRYADDITFSSMQNVYQEDSDFIKEMNRIIIDQNFEINPKKTRLQKRGYRQEVTGIIVNDKTNVNRRYIKQIRAMLYSIEKFGWEKSQKKFEKYYLEDKGHTKKSIPPIENVLHGKLQYLKMVKGDEDPTYLKLIMRFDNLLNPKSNDNKTWSNKHSKKDRSQHNPEKMIELLKKFTSEEPLKSATHPSKNNEEYEELRKKLSTKWRELEKEYSDVLKDKLKDKIILFLKTKKITSGWGMCKIKFGWAVEELKQWCSNNPNSSPELFKGEMQYDDKNCTRTITSFTDVISAFKSEIEISPSHNDFFSFITNISDQIFNEKIKLNIESDEDETVMDEAKFFIDTQWLKIGLETIFKEIKDKQKYSKNVTLSMIKEKQYYELKIKHDNSASKMPPEDIIKRISQGEGTFHKLIDQLHSICDVFLESTYHSEVFRINLLHDKPAVELDNSFNENVDGFVYRLRFYRSKGI